MLIYVNKEKQEIVDSLTLNGLVERLGVDTKGMAIAINNEVIPKSSWDKVQFKENDRVTMIRATAGG